MSALTAALLADMTEGELRELAERLRPFLGVDDGWLDAKAAAAYAGCTVPALRYAMARGEVEFEQNVPGGKVYFRRSALDRWRRGSVALDVRNGSR